MGLADKEMGIQAFLAETAERGLKQEPAGTEHTLERFSSNMLYG